jgi:protein O-GlcNAc transferase
MILQDQAGLSVFKSNSIRETNASSLRSQFELGLEHHSAGRLEEAGAIYQEILRLRPAFADALTSAGLLAIQRKNYQSAVRMLVRAITVNPNHAVSNGYLGLALLNLHHTEAALAVLRRAASLASNNAGFQRWLGLAEVEAGNMFEASEALLSSLALEPENSETGAALLDAIGKISVGDRPELAVEIVDRLHDAPKEMPIKVIYDSAFQLFINGFHQESVAAFRRILDREPEFEIAHAALLDALFLHSPDEGAAFAELERWAGIHAGPLESEQPRHAEPRDNDRRIRIGFLSLHLIDSNTFVHVWPGWFEGYDKSKFEVFAYIDERKPLLTIRDFTNEIDHCRQTEGVSDAALADIIQDDGIDILVDIYGRGPANRMGVLARKPAPVQVAWGPISTGMKAVDYFLADRTVVPRDQFFRYAENIVWLPDSYFAWLPPSDCERWPTAMEQDAEVVFGSFNREVKLTPQTLSVWGEILREVPKSILLFKGGIAARPTLQARVTESFLAAGIDPGRLRFLGTTDQAGHLAAFNDIDIHLDTVPEQGGVTTLEALWSGVPVVTWCYDNRILSRTGATIYESLGLPELIAHSRQDYIDLAVKIAGDVQWRHELTVTLPERLAHSPLVDLSRYSQNLQSAFRMMWERHCAGEPPRHFIV